MIMLKHRFILAALMALGFGLAPAIATASSTPPPIQQNEDAAGMDGGCGFSPRQAATS
ncbi:MAG: hypothetical protein JJU21_00510 [Salinarimonas sp.]|nr:hypothetical protein [Salinarimonas sp.]